MKRGGLAALALLVAVTATPVASAHLGHEVVRAERYLKLDLREGEVRLVVTLTLGEEEGASLMRAADDDGDRKVGEEEASRISEAPSSSPKVSVTTSLTSPSRRSSLR